MRFELSEKGRTAINTVYHVVDESGTVCGSINVLHGQEDDLLKHCRGATAVAEPVAKGAAALVAKSFRAQRRSRGAAGTDRNRPGIAAAILRAAGC